MTDPIELRALSLRQPWCDAVLFGGKRIENRVKWKGSSFRGPFLLHASSGMTKNEYEEVLWFLKSRDIAWRPKPYAEIVRGALVGIARVVDVIMPQGTVHPGNGYNASQTTMRPHPLRFDPFYMGKFAFALDDVRPFETPIPFSGSLSFFKVPHEVCASAIDRLGLSVQYLSTYWGTSKETSSEQLFLNPDIPADLKKDPS